MHILLVALRTLVYMAGFVLVFGWLASSARALDGRLGVVLPTAAMPIGIVLSILGGVLMLVCVGSFIVRGHGTPAPFDAPRALVIIGPYRYVRNPMYVGGLLLWPGLALLLRSPSMLALTAVLALTVHAVVVLYEEPTLRQTLGPSYDAYRKSVRRWIPTWPRTEPLRTEPV